MIVVVMNSPEKHSKAVCEMAKQRRITLTQAVKCDLSYRQMIRVFQNYLKEGDAGLIHEKRLKIAINYLKIALLMI
jgi:hypothetical protein